MPKLQSPGQKRKKIVRVISVIIFIGATYVGSLVSAHFKNIIYAWVDDHQQVSAKVISLTTEESEYRTLKGRKRYETLYLISYDFEVGQEKYENTIEVNGSLHSSLQQGDSLPVWYATDDPQINDSQANIESAVSGNSVAGNLITVAPYTAPASLFLYYLLSLLFVRESKKKLVPGFYTDHSWLDIDDRFVVFLENDELIYFGFHKKLIPKVQRAYQDDKTLEELISISKSKKVNRINLQQISELTSRHNSDVIGIKSDDESYSVEFLNQAIKAHALEAIKVRMPTDLDYKLTQKSRIGAAIPATLFLLSIFLIGYYVDALVVQVILGLIGIVWVIPTVFSRLIDPTEIKIWAKQEQPEALATHK